MKVSLDLNKFKASGVYTIEFDATETINVTSQTIRLVVGFSRKGVFNSPVFLRDPQDSRRVFGTIDSFLEKRGSFFHRAIETCLKTAPVFALNLMPINSLPLNQGGDSTEYRSFSLDSSVSNSNITKALLTSFYNRERFWFPDKSYLQATVDTKIGESGRLFSFVNLGQEAQSIIVRKSQNATRYNITAQEYYESGTIPKYMNKYDYLSDYFVDVYIVQGNWSNLQELSQNPLYQKYFDTRGLKSEQINNFLGLDNITVTGSFTGTIIPDFIDNNNANQSIDRIINNAISVTGIFCTINKDVLEEDEYDNSVFKIDMIGNNLINGESHSIDFLSYSTPIKSIMNYSSNNIVLGNSLLPQGHGKTFNIPYGSSTLLSKPFGGNRGLFFNVINIKKPSPIATGFTIYDYEDIRTNCKKWSLIKTHGTSTELVDDYLYVDDVIDNGGSLNIIVGSELHINTGWNTYIKSSLSYIGNAESNYIIKNVLLQNNIVPASNTFSIVLPADYTLNPSGDIMLIQAPGYVEYFEILSVVQTLQVATVTIKTTPGAVIAPYYSDNFVKYAISVDEFGINPNPNDIQIQIFKTGTTNNKLIPNVATFNIDYINDNVYSGIPMLDNVNNITSKLYNSNSAIISNKYKTFNTVTVETLLGASITSSTVNTYLHIDGYNITTGNFSILQNSAGVGNNPIVLVTPLVIGQIYKIILSNGKIIYGECSSITGNFIPAGGAYSSILSLYEIQYSKGSLANTDFLQSRLLNADRIKWGVGNADINFVSVTACSRTSDSLTYFTGGTGIKLLQWSNSTLTSPKSLNIAKLNNSYNGGVINVSIETPNTKDELTIYSSNAKDIQSRIDLRTLGGNGKTFTLSETNGKSLNVNDYVVNNNVDKPSLIRVLTKVKMIDSLSGDMYFQYTTIDFPQITTVSGINSIRKFTGIQNFADRYLFTALNGFQITEQHLPGSPSQLDKILGVITDTNIGKTLADKDIIDFRYIVDTFNGGIAPQMGAKSILSRLAKNRQKCLAFINMPSIKEFTESTDPRFTDLPSPQTGTPKPILNVEYIATGGNLDLGPSYIFSLPDEENGAKYMGTISPNMIIREDNREKSIPMAADMSNNFILKFLSGQPYSIVAGPRRGVISNSKFVRMEYDYLLSDREFLESAGINPIVNIRNVGPMIYANQTAYQKTISATNNLHVRDLLITIEIAVEGILENYLFQFNDASTRTEISAIVNTYLDGVRNAGGIQSYTVKMNDKNNTPEVISRNFGILDIEIEPAYGIQKFINRVTIKKSGGALSGGFVSV